MSDFARQINRASLISNFGENTGKKKPAVITVQYLQARINLLEKYWTEFYNSHTKLMLLENFEDTDYYKDDIFDDVQNEYIVCLSDLQAEIDKLNVSTATSSTSVNSSSSGFRRVPVLNIPKFSGRQQDWETFKELFCSIIKDDASLSPVEKLQHLLNSVEGAAASSLKGIKVVGANFSVAWDKLLRRYDNSRIRLATHLDSLINLKQVSKKNASDINSLLDSADEAIKGLTDLGCPVDKFDIWLVHLLSCKLDNETREDWEISEKDCKTFSTYDSLRKFLESRVRSLEQAQFTSSQTSFNFKERKNFSSSIGSKSDYKMNCFKSKSVNVHMTKKKSTNYSVDCKYCSGSHKLRDCDLFRRSSVAERRSKVMQLKLCMNCLGKDHRAADCPSNSKCFICEERHHVKLHMENPASRENVAEQFEDRECLPAENKVAHLGKMGSPILLATAQVNLVSPSGDAISVRALIDPGAEASFISQRVVNELCLPCQVANIYVSGVGATNSGVVKNKTNVRLVSQNNSEFSLSVPMLIMDKLTTDLPNSLVRSKDFSHLTDLVLADPHFYRPSRIDCILGADVYGAILVEGLIRGPPNTPIAQKTQFGWVLTGLTSGDKGKEESLTNNMIQSLHVSLEPSLHLLLEKFWEVEQIPTKPILSEEDTFCEELYRNTTVRNSQGRYIVRLPVKTSTQFPDSRNIALSCLIRGEKRLGREPDLRQRYSEFLKEYEDLGHMKLVHPEENNSSMYYLPHHSVLGTNGKLRVVFNASQKCQNGLSLNDVLYCGRKLQQELSAVISRWRLGKYAFSCDIVKMFRQILVAEEDQNLQRILWRPNLSGEIQEYTLLTVTYGTAPAPYLAIRTLLQLADDEACRFPEAAHLLQQLSYVDDIYGSGDSLEAILGLRDQLINLLSSAGMSLSKWSANNPRLLDGLSNEKMPFEALELNASVSTLGLLWFPGTDLFSFKVTLGSTPSKLTKRSILSEIAKLFDPLGWLAPVIVQGKILMQDLWISGVDWDSPISDDISNRWLSIREDFLAVQQIQIPRWIRGVSNSTWEIHGFCDASSRAYAAAVYLKANSSQPFLLMAKTKVAPLKTLSIPRLELCGALLLARLVQYILSELSISPSRVLCWTDSSVVLSWLNHHPSKWTTFVANRVSQILELSQNIQWKYISTSENPADCASRGISARSLKEFSLWWHGPVWLNHDTTQWPTGNLSLDETDLEIKTHTAAYNVQTDLSNSVLESLEKFSSLSKVISVLAYILRWLRKSRKLEIGSSFLSAEELKFSHSFLYRMIQNKHFLEDIRLIKKNLPVSNKSPLRRLTPFLDDNKLLRLGGRLQYSNLTYDEKHPILLPRNSYFSKLLVKEAHHLTMHGGPRLMESYLNRKYWIIHGKRLIHSVYRRCVKCTRYKSTSVPQQMAPLPSYRLEPQRPFAFTGLDYAGPFAIRAHKGRGNTSSKGYVAIFICMVTRSVHLEIVSDLTTQTFLAAYRRFTARRGNCINMYSDNATTFHGAASELKELFSITSSFCEELAKSLAKEGTTWTFIPPRAPHFGGLWEAAVRSFKYHLKRVVGESKLTFEEFSTLAAQIEACLNSRPLCPMSNNPEDVTALTPGHFLIGAPLKAPPEPFKETDLTKSVTSRWKHLLIMRNHFWMRWRKEVVQQFQQRNKWLNATNSIQVDDLVLIKDEQQPPTRWPIGRVSKLYIGADGLVRVADIRTGNSIWRRPIVKLVKIPSEPETVSAYSAMISLD